jgi:hypothetical protein
LAGEGDEEMSEMVERVAQAIFASAEEVFKWEHLVPEAHDRYRRHARAAIEAMLSLPEDVRLAAQDATGLNARQVGDVHRALIQAALKEPTR